MTTIFPTLLQKTEHLVHKAESFFESHQLNKRKIALIVCGTVVAVAGVALTYYAFASRANNLSSSQVTLYNSKSLEEQLQGKIESLEQEKSDLLSKISQLEPQINNTQSFPEQVIENIEVNGQENIPESITKTEPSEEKISTLWQKKQTNQENKPRYIPSLKNTLLSGIILYGITLTTTVLYHHQHP